jgi:hypothetical protein
VAPAPLTVVPTWRLGALLRGARERQGRTTTELASQSPRFGAPDLEAIEEGERALDERELAAVVELYGVEGDHLVPHRHELTVDLDHRELAAAGHTQALAGSNPTPDEVLGTYLTLVYSLRSAEPGTPLKLRAADMTVLGRALALAVPEIEHRLEVLMGEPEPVALRQRSRLLSRRILIPAAGVLVAVCVGGALVLTSRSTPTVPPPSTTSSVDVGSTVVVTPTSTPVVTGNDIPLSAVPKGGVGLAPPQVATRGPGGVVKQTDRTTSTSTSSSTSTTQP